MNREEQQVTPPDPHKRINAARVCAICGGVSDMTLWRWLNDPALNFPKPVYICRRRYWREADVVVWWDSKDEVAA